MIKKNKYNLFNKKIMLSFIILLFISLLFSCDLNDGYIRFKEENIELKVNETITLDYEISDSLKNETVYWSSNNDCIEVSQFGFVLGKDTGEAVVTIKASSYSDEIKVIAKENIDEKKETLYKVELTTLKSEIKVNETLELDCITKVIRSDKVSYESNEYSYKIISGDANAIIKDNILTGIKKGTVEIQASYNDILSNIITIEIIDDKIIEETLVLSSSKDEIYIGETVELFIESNTKDTNDITYELSNAKAMIDGNILTGLSSGKVDIVCVKGELRSNKITITINCEIVFIEIQASKYYLSSDENEVTSIITNFYPLDAKGEITYEIKKGTDCAYLFNKNQIRAVSPGVCTIIAKCGEIESEEIEINIVEGIGIPSSISIKANQTKCYVNDYVVFSYEVYPQSSAKNIEFYINEGEENGYLVGNKLYITNDGKISVIGKINGVISNEIVINEVIIDIDPYQYISQKDFYANYTPASSYIDSYYRSLHNLMSGSIIPQDQAPKVINKPKENGLYLRNSTSDYSDDGNTYYVYDVNGKVVNEIYKGGAYVSLEEVAAYVLAFSDVPINYTERKNADPSDSIWGEYLRLNHSYFSGSVSKYPYEPILPNISGCGGNFDYYEIDIGTTGTDCDPNYEIRVYNNGKKITRGAARIVYTRYDENGDTIIDINERFVFYTYNHYNDFQEYLNYENGWGEMFGNITGGGKLSSTSNYNPSPYVPVILKNFKNNYSFLFSQNCMNIPLTFLKQDKYC